MINKNVFLIMLATILFLSGIIVGLLLSKSAPVDQINSHTGGPYQPSAPGMPAMPVQTKAFESYKNLPSEWISKEKRLEGHSMLLELQQGGMFIFESCRAHLYVDANGKPALPDQDFCKLELQGRVAAANGERITIRADKTGEQVDLNLKTKNSGDQLIIQLNKNTYTFEKGSRNDLLQYFEHQPEVIKAKEVWGATLVR